MTSLQEFKATLTPEDRETLDKVLRLSQSLTLLCSRSLQQCIAGVVLAVQRGKELALQRKRLRLFVSPFRTLFYFSGSASAATGRGLVWLLKHRITLFILIPAILGYVALKLTGRAELCSRATIHNRCNTRLAQCFQLEAANQVLLHTCPLHLDEIWIVCAPVQGGRCKG